MNYTKEQKAHVKKFVYAFKVTDKQGGSFQINFTDSVTKTLPMSDDLETLFNRINKPEISYIEQYYVSKDDSEKYCFKFEEMDEKKWRNKK